MLKFGCTLPSSANICSHKATDIKCFSFTGTTKGLLEKIREELVSGSSIVSTRKAVVDETFDQKSTNLCKTSIGNDASLLHHHSLCQQRPTGVNTRWDCNSRTQRFAPHRK